LALSKNTLKTALHEREQHMEILVEKRTEQLEIKKNEVEELLKSITERNEELEDIVAERTKSLRNSNQELVRSNKDLEQFAYIASHDLQEPLRTVGSFISLLKRNHEENLPEDALQYLAFITDGVHRMSNLIKSLLTYSKIGREGSQISSCNLNFLLTYKFMDIGKKIEEQNVVIEMDFLPEIFCERNQLGMVFYNLVVNAIKFNKSETPIIKINHHDDAPEGFWKFSVQDNGIGIAEKYQTKIFEIFSRLNGRSYEGTGIGLATFFLTVSKSLGNQEAKTKSETGQNLVAS